MRSSRTKETYNHFQWSDTLGEPQIGPFFYYLSMCEKTWNRYKQPREEFLLQIKLFSFYGVWILLRSFSSADSRHQQSLIPKLTNPPLIGVLEELQQSCVNCRGVEKSREERFAIEGRNKCIFMDLFANRRVWGGPPFKLERATTKSTCIVDGGRSSVYWSILTRLFTFD